MECSSFIVFHAHVNYAVDLDIFVGKQDRDTDLEFLRNEIVVSQEKSVKDSLDSCFSIFYYRIAFRDKYCAAFSTNSSGTFGCL